MDWHNDLELDAELEMRYEDTYDYQDECERAYFNGMSEREAENFDWEDDPDYCEQCFDYHDWDEPSEDEIDNAADREARW